MEDIKTTVAKQIVTLRTKSGMTQLELAEKLHYSDKAVSKWERGESVPELSTLVAIADLFDVSLDELIRDRKPIENEEPILQPTPKIGASRGIITAMSILLVWFIASLFFVLLDMIPFPAKNHWLAFIYALPVSFLVLLILNAIWFNRRRNYPIISLLMWSLLAAFHISFAVFSIHIWQIYLLGIPGQVIILLWSRLHRKKSETP